MDGWMDDGFLRVCMYPLKYMYSPLCISICMTVCIGIFIFICTCYMPVCFLIKRAYVHAIKFTY